MSNSRQPYPNELWHYGILGQKWGVRRYQNPDGSYTEAGKKRYATSIQKSVNKVNYWKSGPKEVYENVTSIKNEVADNIYSNQYKQIKNVDQVLTAFHEFREAAKEEKDFYDSNECKEASSKAYRDTIDWFKKNDPEYLQDIINKNNGRDDDLDAYHDFRKTFEGFEDEAFEKAEKAFYSNPENKAAKERVDKAYNKYMTECQKAADDLIGEYGNRRLSSYGYGNSYKNVKDLVAGAVRDFAQRAMKNIDRDRANNFGQASQIKNAYDSYINEHPNSKITLSDFAEWYNKS